MLRTAWRGRKVTRILDKRQRDRLIQVAAEVDRLRAELAKAEAELDQLLPKTNGAEVSGLVTEDSVPNRVCKLLESGPGKTFNAQQIAESLDVTNLPSLRSALARMVKAGQIQSPARGIYVAKISAAPLSADERELFGETKEEDEEGPAFADEDPFA